MDDWIAYLEAEPKSEPFLSIAAAWKTDKARLAELEAGASCRLHEIKSLRARLAEVGGEDFWSQHDEIHRLSVRLARYEAALRDIAAFGLRNSGCGYSCARKAEAALADSASAPLKGGVPLSEYIAEMEKDPEMKAELDKARERIKSILADQPSSAPAFCPKCMEPSDATGRPYLTGYLCPRCSASVEGEK